MLGSESNIPGVPDGLFMQAGVLLLKLSFEAIEEISRSRTLPRLQGQWEEG
jgi:hypothetical protein